METKQMNPISGGFIASSCHTAIYHPASYLLPTSKPPGIRGVSTTSCLLSHLEVYRGDSHNVHHISHTLNIGVFVQCNSEDPYLQENNDLDCKILYMILLQLELPEYFFFFHGSCPLTLLAPAR